MSKLTMLTIVTGLALTITSNAHARACASTDAPAPFNAATCNGGGAAAICQVAGGVLDCGLARNGASFGAYGIMVANFNPGTDTYSGWGVSAAGGNFCCVFDGGGGATVTSLEMHGSSLQDTLMFTYDSGTSRWDLEDADGSGGITASMYAGGAADELDGSFASSVYQEILDGEFGNDTINGNDGGDVCRGGSGDDLIDGGVGVDTIDGYDGDDWSTAEKMPTPCRVATASITSTARVGPIASAEATAMTTCTAVTRTTPSPVVALLTTSPAIPVRTPYMETAIATSSVTSTMTSSPATAAPTPSGSR